MSEQIIFAINEIYFCIAKLDILLNFVQILSIIYQQNFQYIIIIRKPSKRITHTVDRAGAK